MADIEASLTGSQPDLHLDLHLDLTGLSEDTLEASFVSEDLDLPTDNFNPFSHMQDPNAVPLFHGLYSTSNRDTSSVSSARSRTQIEDEWSEVKFSKGYSDTEVDAMVNQKRQDGRSFTFQNTLELLQEIALLKDSIGERDVAIETLHREKEDLEEKTKELSEVRHQLQELTQSVGDRERSWQDKCHRLQRELDRLKKIETFSDPRAKVQLLETELREMTEQVNTQERNTKHIQQAIDKLKTKGASGESSVKRRRELQSQLSRAETTLVILRQEQQDIRAHLSLTRNHLNTSQSSSSSLYDVIKVYEDPQQLVSCELVLTSGGVGFLHGRDSDGKLMVKHTEESSPLEKGDRILEAQGQSVNSMQDAEFNKLLRAATGKLKLVVLRPAPSQPITNHDAEEEMESLKEDLSLAMMELETVQHENKDMNKDIDQLKGRNHRLESDRDKMQAEITQLKKQLKESEDQWQSLRELIGRGHSRQQETGSSLNQSAEEPRRSQGPNDVMNGNLSSEPNQVLAYDEFDTMTPLWETLSTSPKGDILQALKDHILETSQQKRYLDNLVSVVLETNPKLLLKVDSRVGLGDAKAMQFKAGTEEFC